MFIIMYYAFMYSMFCLKYPILQEMSCHVCVCMCVCAHQYYPAHTPRAPVAYTLEHTATSRQYVTTAKKYVTLLL